MHDKLQDGPLAFCWSENDPINRGYANYRDEKPNHFDFPVAFSLRQPKRYVPRLRVLPTDDCRRRRDIPNGFSSGRTGPL